MTPISPLAVVSQVLAESFRKAAPAKRRNAVRLACVLSTSFLGLKDAGIEAALEGIQKTSTGNTALRKQMDVLAAQFDEAYFQLDESADVAEKEKAHELFLKARAFSSLAFGLSNEEADLEEALYEAIHAFDDPADLLRRVEAALQ